MWTQTSGPMTPPLPPPPPTEADGIIQNGQEIDTPNAATGVSVTSAM